MLGGHAFLGLGRGGKMVDFEHRAGLGATCLNTSSTFSLGMLSIMGCVSVPASVLMSTLA